MTIKKLMVPYFDEETFSAAFSTASIVGRPFNAHLDIVHIRQRITLPLRGNDYYPIAVSNVEEHLEILQAAADQRAAELNTRLRELCSKLSVTMLEGSNRSDDKGVTASWTDIEKDLPLDLSGRARVADITVLTRPGDLSQRYGMNLVEDIIFQSGRSLLIVDQQNRNNVFPDTVMIAWDGGREAARAVHEALPLLRRAKAVIVASIGEMANGVEASECITAYLKLHGVHANCMHASLDRHENAEELFLKHVKSKSADLVVMGAYSRGRWREMVLGGFTRFMLRNTDISVLMAH